MEFQNQWVLWYHDPTSADYSIGSYIKLAEVGTVDSFWAIVHGISAEAWNSGMFFFMRKGVPPLWDAPENERGGAWSKKIDASDTHTVFVDCMVHCIAESFLTKHPESVVGVTLSPKGQFHIVKIWNSTTSISDRRLFAPTLKMKVGDDIAYKAHNLRPK